jgi:hypothetical protein
MFSVSSKLVIDAGNWGGIENKSIFFKSRSSSGLKRVSNSIKANDEFVGVDSKVWHSEVTELRGETMFKAIVIVVRASLKCSFNGPLPQSDRLVRFPKRCLCLS